MFSNLCGVYVKEGNNNKNPTLDLILIESRNLSSCFFFRFHKENNKKMASEKKITKLSEQQQAVTRKCWFKGGEKNICSWWWIAFFDDNFAFNVSPTENNTVITTWWVANVETNFRGFFFFYFWAKISGVPGTEFSFVNSIRFSCFVDTIVL